MNPLDDRRILAAIGAVIVLLLAVLVGVFMTHQSKSEKAAEAKGALQVDAVHDEAKVSQTKPLRCFVNGQYIGDFPVLECANKNGVAAQALDVGLDPATGQMAGGAAPAPLQPLPAPTPAAAPAPVAPQPQEAMSSAIQAGDCMRYSNGEWRGVGRDLSIGQCARVLFDGRCVHPGDALYGRSGANTVRLVPGRVEISGDNHTFRPLVAQDPQDCSLPPG